ncbi:MAG: phage tail protein, partial [Acidaminococcaceae bacterium]
MPNWNGLILTKKGRVLQVKVEAGAILTLTKMKLGDGSISGSQTLEDLTDLVAPRQNIGIATKEVTDNGLCKISSTISNAGLTAGYYVKELGVFAEDPDEGEILYAITTDTAPDYMPAEGGAMAISQEFAVYVAVSNADSVIVQIDPGALATMGYVSLHIQDHNTNASAHSDMVGATATSAGKRGMLPAPAIGDDKAFFAGDGTWKEVPTPSVMIGATASVAGKAGLVPAPEILDKNKVLKGDGTWGDIFDLIYPVGSIYMSTAETSPAVLFGGTWEAMPAGRVLLAQGTSAWGTEYAAGSTGGEATHTLTVGELPAHGHTAAASALNIYG